MSVIRTLAGSIREYKKTSILTPLFVTGEVVMECIIPLIMAQLIDEMAGGTMTPILRLGLVLIIMAMVSLAFGTLSARSGAIASTGLAKNLRQDMFFRIQDFAFGDIDRFHPSSLVTRMTTDVTNVQNAYNLIIRLAVRTPLMIIFSVVMTVRINPRMALIFLGIIPVLAVALGLIMFKTMPIFRRIFKKYDAMNNDVEENVSGIRVVKAFVREDYEQKKFEKEAEEVKNDFTGAEKILAFNTPVMMFSIYLAILLVSAIGARLIVTSGGTSFTTGELSSVITYGVQILSAMMMLSMVFVMTSLATESAERISEVLNYNPTLVSPPDGITDVPDGHVEFDHVSFKYSERSKRYALKDINLDIPSGSTVGIIGGTGSSKSTLIQLISRLYDVTEGELRVGGIDVRRYDLTTLRDAVAVVLQKNVLFSGTIKENMRWGNENATDEEIERVCRLSQADEFVQQMPKKYDTYIEQGGTNVSGGQKQRLCIARALLKKPKVLILDDSTSAVDTKTDALIRQAFKTEIPDTTKILIAQRVSSVEDADQILVMDGGRIVERGTSDELRRQGGIYAEIYDSQTKGKEE